MDYIVKSVGIIVRGVLNFFFIKNYKPGCRNEYLIANAELIN